MDAGRSPLIADIHYGVRARRSFHEMYVPFFNNKLIIYCFALFYSTKEKSSNTYSNTRLRAVALTWKRKIWVSK